MTTTMTTILSNESVSRTIFLPAVRRAGFLSIPARRTGEPAIVGEGGRGVVSSCNRLPCTRCSPPFRNSRYNSSNEIFLPARQSESFVIARTMEERVIESVGVSIVAFFRQFYLGYSRESRCLPGAFRVLCFSTTDT